MSESVPSPLVDQVYQLQEENARLEALYRSARDLMFFAASEASLARNFVRDVVGLSFAKTATLFRYEPDAGRLRVFHDSVTRAAPVESTVLSPADVDFLEGTEARQGVWCRSSELTASARAFTRDQGKWLSDWGTEALIPIRPSGGLWGVLGLGERSDGLSYGQQSLDALAKLVELLEGAIEAGFGKREVLAGAVAPGAPRTVVPAQADLATLRAAYPALQDIVGESPSLAGTLRELVQVAPTRVPVLILGPTGTGKELAARAIHQMSPRADGPFEVVDCGAIPRELIESELFGHVRGAFTGATRDRRGAFELAHNGTLFLDEIGELPPGAQTRLLRVLQEGQLRRVGDERTIHVSVRVVAATNRDLARMAQEGRFRADLFYRVSVFTAQMPALADRREDLPLLARHVLGRLATETGRPEPKLSPALLRRLSEYNFPGNVRELQNVLTRLVLRAGIEGPTVEDLDAAISQSSDRPSLAAAAAGARVIEDELDTPGRGDAGKIGPWVVTHLRRHEFNLSQAERALDRIQRSPAGKSAAPVADRASLNYYLQGELLRCFHESGYDVEHAAANVAGNAELSPRVRHRLRKLLARIAEGIGSFGEEDAARRAARKLFPKLPAYYNPHVDAAAVAFVRGEWSRPPAEALVADEDDD